MLPLPTSQHVLRLLSRWSRPPCNTRHKALLIVRTAFENKSNSTHNSSLTSCCLFRTSTEQFAESCSRCDLQHITFGQSGMHQCTVAVRTTISNSFSAQGGNCCITSSSTQQRLTTLVIIQRVYSDHATVSFQHGVPQA